MQSSLLHLWGLLAPKLARSGSLSAHFLLGPSSNDLLHCGAVCLPLRQELGRQPLRPSRTIAALRPATNGRTSVSAVPL